MQELCPICYDGDSEIPICFQQSIPYIQQSCPCNPRAHVVCFQQWFQINSKCLICVKPIAFQTASQRVAQWILLFFRLYFFFLALKMYQIIEKAEKQ
jgi:hypothetical protein